MPERLSWEEYGLELARTASLRAACSRRQVGAAILNPRNRIVSLGYNGTPSGDVHCTDGGCPRGQMSYEECPAFGTYANCNGLHAEHNAILNAEVSVLGCTICVTRQPCADCERLILNAGLTRVVYPEDDGSIVVRNI